MVEAKWPMKFLPPPEKAKAKVKVTKNSKVVDPEVKHENIAMLYGTQPSKMVNADTDMVYDFVKNLNSRFDKRTLALDLPKAFDNMRGKDAKFEFVVTSTI